MKTWLTFAPWWAVSLVLVVVFSIVRFVISILGEVTGLAPYDFSTDFPGDLVSAGFFGLFMGLFVTWANRRAEAAADLESREDFLAANRAVHRGPVPADPRLRAAAFRMAVNQLEITRGVQRYALPLFGLGAVATAALAFFSSPWFLLGTVLFGSLLILNVVAIRRLEHRMYLLFERDDELESGSY